MAPSGAHERLRFGEFELDVARYQLLRRGRPVRLERQPMDVLILLVERRGRLVSRGEIISRLWPDGVFVEVDAGVHTTVRKIRRALRDSPTAPRFIETVHGKGYRFVGVVEAVAEPQEGPSFADSETAVAGRATATRNDGEGPAPARVGDQQPVALPDSTTATGHENDEAHLTELRDVYWRRHDELKRNLLRQFVATVGAALAFRYIRADFLVPELNATFPTTWLCFVIPAILIFLWLDFGFVLDDLIKSRSKAWHLLSQRKAPGRAAAFNDGGFVDGWFMCFRPTEHAIDTTFLLGSTLFFTVFYCPLFAANHALAIRLLALGADRLNADSGWRPSLKLLTQSLSWLAGGGIVISHVQFRFGGRNPNWAQLVVIVMAVLLLYVLSTTF